MIYIGKGLYATTYEEVTATDKLEFFENYNQDSPTKQAADYFISGVLKGKKRSNENLLEKDLIALDLDLLPTSTTIESLFETATNKLKVDFALYPTSSHNKPKMINGQEVTCPRFRIIVPLKNPVGKHESDILDHLANYISEKLGVEHDPTGDTWSQHQGLPLDSSNTRVNRVGKQLDARHIYRVTYTREEVAFPMEEKPRHNIIQRMGVIPEDVSDRVVNRYIDKNRHGKLLEPTFYLGPIMCLAMHVVKGDMEEVAAIRYARQIGLDGVTQDGKTWADHNENALKTRIRKGGSNFNTFQTTQDFWTMFNAQDQYQLVMIQGQEDTHWLNNLKRTQKEPHAIHGTMENLGIILTNDSELKDLLLFNEFSEDMVKGKKAPWDSKFHKYWTDTDISELRVYLSYNYGVDFGKDTTYDVTLSVARKNSFHPIKSMIESKPWDGIERAETLFIDYLAADNNDYVKAVARKWLVGGIARIYKPAVKFEIVPVLEGKQGKGKSTLVAKLGGEYFSDGLPDMKSKDSKEYLRGAWIVELGELSAMKKTELEQVKAFISTAVDRYRPSFGRITKNQERTCVFIGSTNEKGFLKDKTGNRRFYPIPIGYNGETSKDVFTLDEDTVQQIWAEAYYYYLNEEELFFTHEVEELAESYRADATETDVLQEDIYRYLEIPLHEKWYEGYGDKVNYIQQSLKGTYQPEVNYIQQWSKGISQPEVKTMTRDFVSIKEIMNEVLELKVADARGRREQKLIQLIMDNHPEWVIKNGYHPITKKKTRGYYRK